MKKYFIILVVLLSIGAATVYAQIAVPDPIVIIPGIGASWNSDVMLDPTPTPSLSDWDFTLTVNQYDQLIRSFEDAGLVQGEDFFIAFYDWRQHNDDSASNYLVPVIDQALAHSESGKIDIVAHSMGGLVARAYIQGGSYRNDVDELVMLGTPNHGSSDIYTLWEGGEIPASWDRTIYHAIAVYLWYTRTVGGAEDNYAAIHTHLRSIQELLPTYDFLVDKETAQEIESEEMIETNTFLQVLNSYNAFELATKVDGGITSIAGEGQGTVGTIPVVPRTEADGVKWIDGKPDPLSPELNNTEGDNRVLTSSAFLEDDAPHPVYNTDPVTPLQKLVRFFTPTAHAEGFFFEQFSIPSKHGDLPTNAIEQVFSTLGLGTPGTYALIPEPEEVLSFWFASPIDVQITAPGGGIITKTANTIPGAEYSGASDPLGFKMVVIANPEPGSYAVQLTGLAEGAYHMGVGGFTANGDTEATVQGTTTPNQLTAYAVTYNPNNASSTIVITEPTPEDPDEEPTAAELLDHLIATVQAHVDTTTGKQQKAFRALLATLRVADHFLDHDRPLLAIATLKVFDAEVKALQKKQIISSEVSTDLLAQSKEVQEAIKSAK